jgi:4-amino-4-deoxy-L-arabinose transferase-like glycosyltransferase
MAQAMEEPDGPAGETLPPRATLLLLALAAGLLLFRLGAVPLLGPDEPRYVRVAVEMHRAGEHVTPTLQGRPWLEKPVLYYWLAGAAFSALGETETAARLPSALAALAMIGATALVGARLYGTAAGLHAGFVLATSLGVFVYGRAATMDMLVASAITIGLGLFALGLLRVAGRLAIPVAYAALAVATLAKGPIGFLLPGLVVFGHLVATRERSALRRALSPVGIVLFLLVAGPWYALVYAAQGRAFVDTFLLNHNVQRFTSTIHNHPGSLLYYLPVLLLLLFPWSGLVLPALAALRPRASRVDLFVLLWLLMPLAFFSAAASKLPGYVVPCLPPLALLAGRAAAWIAAGAFEPPPWAAPRVVGVIGLALGTLIAMTPVLLMQQGEPAWRLTVPLGAWSLITMFMASRVWSAQPAGAPAILRVAGAGFLLLLTAAAPVVLARQQSGRALFLPAHGREVLVWNAWRTAWMSGYFYNDGRVREVSGLPEIQAALGSGSALVLCGPSERRMLEGTSSLQTLALAVGPKQTTLLKVAPR